MCLSLPRWLGFEQGDRQGNCWILRDQTSSSNTWRPMVRNHDRPLLQHVGPLYESRNAAVWRPFQLHRNAHERSVPFTLKTDERVDDESDDEFVLIHMIQGNFASRTPQVSTPKTLSLSLAWPERCGKAFFWCRRLAVKGPSSVDVVMREQGRAGVTTSRHTGVSCGRTVMCSVSANLLRWEIRWQPLVEPKKTAACVPQLGWCGYGF